MAKDRFTQDVPTEAGFYWVTLPTSHIVYVRPDGHGTWWVLRAGSGQITPLDSPVYETAKWKGPLEPGE